MEILIPFISLISAIFGALLNNYFSGKRQDQQNLLANRRLQEQITVANNQQKRQNKINMTIQLYEQYEASEAARARTEIIKLFERYKQSERPLNYRTIMKYESEFQSLHQYLHFFERVSILHKIGYLDENLFNITLAPPFHAFYSMYISQLIKDTENDGEGGVHWMKNIEDLASLVENIDDIETSVSQYFVKV